MTHKVYIPLGVVKQLADKMTAALSCQRIGPSTAQHEVFCYCTVLPQSTGQNRTLCYSTAPL